MKITTYIVKKFLTEQLNKHILSPFGFSLCKDCMKLIYDDGAIRCYDCQAELNEYRLEEARQEAYEDSIYDLD